MNLMERMNQVLKDRLECFDDYSPCWKENCDRAHVHDWIQIYSFFYNYVKDRTSLGSPPAAPSPSTRMSEVERLTTLIIQKVMKDA